MAKQIKEIFKSEDETIYYEEFKIETIKKEGKIEKITKNASGKLLDHYRYIRKMLIAGKILNTSKNDDTANETASDENFTAQTATSSGIYSFYELKMQNCYIDVFSYIFLKTYTPISSFFS